MGLTPLPHFADMSVTNSFFLLTPSLTQCDTKMLLVFCFTLQSPETRSPIKIHKKVVLSTERGGKEGTVFSGNWCRLMKLTVCYA